MAVKLVKKPTEETALRELTEEAQRLILAAKELPFSKEDLKKIAELPPSERPFAASALLNIKEGGKNTLLFLALTKYELESVPKKTG
ncbi:MAG: hypothetical protein QXG98_00995 [Candidatus Micrarchaeia archaeon]